MDEKTMTALAELLPGESKEKRWILLMADRTGIDVMSNIQDLDERRQLAAKADVIWAESIKANAARARIPKKLDRDEFKRI